MKTIKQTLVGVACAGLVSLASAATVKVTFDNLIWSDTGHDAVNLTYLTNKSPTPGSTAPDFTTSATTTINGVGAGRFEGTASELNGIAASVFVNGVAGATVVNDLYMYCYDIYQGIYHGDVVTYEVDMTGETERTRDFLGAVNSVLNSGRAVYDKYAWLRPANSYQSAAIQLGIWESLYDNNDIWSLSNQVDARGFFYASGIESGSGGVRMTQQYLDDFFGAIGKSQSVEGKDVMVLKSSTHQNMITGDPVPEPGTLALLGAALVGWGLSRRNKAIKQD